MTSLPTKQENVERCWRGFKTVMNPRELVAIGSIDDTDFDELMVEHRRARLSSANKICKMRPMSIFKLKQSTVPVPMPRVPMRR